MSNEREQYQRNQTDEQVHASGQQVAQQAAMSKQAERLQNPRFLDALRDADIDSELVDWLEDEYPDWFSGAHAISNRGELWDQIADMQMFNKRERRLAERDPGRLLKDRPFLLAAAQGADSPHADAYDRGDIPGSKAFWRERVAAGKLARAPMDSDEQSAMFGGAEVAASLKALARDAAGLESVSTVKTESEVHREESEQSTKERLGGLMG
jgi:hypothetical protein